MNELELKYGCNPNQKPARVFMKNGAALPFTVLNGKPGYINLLDAFNSWQLVRELKEATGLPAAASFKHVSPAGAALGLPLDEVDKRVYFVAPGAALSPIACAYIRARGADRLCSYGDWAALSDTCDETAARLLLPEKSNGRMIIACHGAHSSGICEFCFSAPYFHRMGYTILMPEHRGCGESEGKFLGYGTHESKDTFLWIDCARKRFPELDIFLLGVSMGGATVLMMSDKITDPTVKGIIADCSYTSAWDEFAYQLKNPFGLPAFPLLYIFDLYCRIICKYSLRDASPIKAVRSAKVPILFIHGAKDALVPVKMQKELFDACPTQKEMLTVENAVHAQSYYTDPRAYEAAAEKFINECENTENTSALFAPGGGKQIG